MPDPDIPVEVRIAAMRANADFLETMHLHHAAKVLRDEADLIEREHTERAAFIDELAKVYADGMQYFAIEDDWLGWEELSEINREAIRAGIRAVLDRLDELDGDGNDTKTLRQWSRLRDVPDDVLAVFTPPRESPPERKCPSRLAMVLRIGSHLVRTDLSPLLHRVPRGPRGCR
ncbi:hypothetical protein OED52_13780 [Rhodococcus sp. Z13]|uniref:Uncharacterized protein n=1 Tax=Rhodococcus sacchari TaxID=2962047 RepID=A0ACD4DCM4_9NOCA|nr:hypothetical protein [Rhodococcus sp. Z13]UYP17742.1 hypothetical protein OED52_13780 [Rhodococcus sp. Z13]